MDDHGTALPALLGLLLGGALVLGVAIDLTRWASSHREAAAVADAAAQAGASQVSPGALRDGDVTVDPVAADVTARDMGATSRPRLGRLVDVVVLGNEVCVVVEQPFDSHLLSALGVPARPVVGRACAVPARG